MVYTLDRLMSDGGMDVPYFYQQAAGQWSRALSGMDEEDPEKISAVAPSVQSWCESNCGGRPLSHEIMVYAGVLRYRTEDGFGDSIRKARAMVDGLINSRCSVEIHRHARHVAGMFPDLSDMKNQRKGSA